MEKLKISGWNGVRHKIHSENMEATTILIRRIDLIKINNIVKNNLYNSRDELIRIALYHLLINNIPLKDIKTNPIEHIPFRYPAILQKKLLSIYEESNFSKICRCAISNYLRLLKEKKIID